MVESESLMLEEEKKVRHEILQPTTPLITAGTITI